MDHLGPDLDETLASLDETDRDAILLRYFEKKSAQEMAEILGISAEAAQKRVSRAVEQLREAYAKRGSAVASGALVIWLSANSVQAAPAALAASIATAATLTGAAVSTTSVALGATIPVIRRRAIRRASFDGRRADEGAATNMKTSIPFLGATFLAAALFGDVGAVAQSQSCQGENWHQDNQRQHDRRLQWPGGVRGAGARNHFGQIKKLR